ncbi:MAG: putative acyl-CoA dehydrogenase FadE17 [Acidimicrobiales bacterium]|nr:MAG: acyl-CoA dehydrogenase [Actinomycetota bacterium]MBV6510004.1 putative acyl-CoA dehydrogenase FadE17 [Acidimicrobiales bacterium]RIK04305.1 MAG: acyl-CoA dehydrogenase [Acidobacteriota bacterium]
MAVTSAKVAATRGGEVERLGRLIEQVLARHDEREDPSLTWGAMYDAGLAWVDFPEGRGGLGLSPDLQELIDRRFVEAGVPSNIARNMMGVGMAAPTLIAFGTDEQQQQHLRRIFTCEDIWCQMFSEPGAGSDIASLSTRAVRDGDEWVVNGQKVWTTIAHVADKGLLLARSDPDVPKHQGLTYFWIDMHSPGVEVRPLRQLTGEAEFNEVYLTDVRVPDSGRIGEVGQGWAVAIATLMNERTMLGRLADPSRSGNLIDHVLDLWVDKDDKDPLLRDRVVQVWIEDEIIRLLMMRAESLRKQGTPGPESSLGKVAVSPHHQRLFGLCMDLLGPEAMLISDYEMRRPATVSPAILGEADTSDTQKAFLTAVGATIGGGTTEIAKNVIGERVLGLPKEPSVDRDLPWSQVPRN